ncbi:MAG: histidinol-phosphatase [Spirochaetia bacterium]|nr:histidinol-phosphatase [Spirochaetia bacterium]
MRSFTYPSNCHTHCYLDDGQESLESYAVKAISLGFTSLGYSCHTPLNSQPDEWRMQAEDFSIYIDEVTRLKNVYCSKIEIYAGLEMDYLDDSGLLAGMEYAEFLDFSIASVHGMYHKPSGTYLTIDGPVEEFETLLRDNFSGDIRKMVSCYFDLQKSLIRNHTFDVLAHCDLIKKRNINNRFFNQNDAWYRDLSLSMLDEAEKAGTRIEVNTGGLSRGATSEVYPNKLMLKKCAELGIPMVLSADAHNPEHLDFYFTEALEEMKNAGCRNIQYLAAGKWDRFHTSFDSD